MRNVTVTRRVSINMTAEDWALYRSMDGVEQIAKQMSRQAEDAINSASTRGEASRQLGKILERYEDWGAADTEPVHVASRLLDEVFA